jgi:lipopolysaccharide transport system ATP-binding protein
VDEVLAVGDAEFQRKCLGKMSDVAQQGRTVLFVSHNMSAIQRLTAEAIILEKGHLVLRAPTPQAVDYYLQSGFSQTGQRTWDLDEIPTESKPFRPVALRLCDRNGNVVDTIRSTEPVSIQVEYVLEAPISGLRVGLYLLTTRGEYVFTSFDTDNPDLYEHFGIRQAGHYMSECVIPANFFNEGRYILGLNASSFRMKRYFQDEQALSFSVDVTGAPGMQWPEPRSGSIRPDLDWKINTL